MPIKVSCKCGQSFAAKDQMAGKTVRCPKCKQPLKIPGPQAKSGAKSAGPQGVRPKTPAAQVPVAAAGGDLGDLFDEIGVAPEQPTQGPRCPSCGKGLPPHALICVNCGFNLQTGQRIASTAPAPVPAKGGDGHGGTSQAEALVAKAAKEIEENPIAADASDFGEGTNPWAWVLTLFLPLLFALAVFAVLQWSQVLAPFAAILIAGLLDLNPLVMGFGMMLMTFGVVFMISWFKITFAALDENVFLGLLCIIVLLIFVPIYGFIRHKKLLFWTITYLVTGFVTFMSMLVLILIALAIQAARASN